MSTELAATSTVTYDLMLLLDVAAEDGVRAAILKDVESAIKGEGELTRHDRWGVRELAYPIEHKRQADYHLFQFSPASADLLRGLDRTLRITDGVIRFRIVKLEAGTPAAPSPPPAAQAGHHPAAHATRPPRAAEPAGEAAASAVPQEEAPVDGEPAATVAATEPTVAATEPAVAAEGTGEDQAAAQQTGPEQAPAGEAAAPAEGQGQ